MGPLVPHIIGDELNLIVAIILGILFGFVLEQAGFSSTKKLVGLFYGYDFTVLRVFFTAGITAMTGVILMAHMGMLDMEAVYVNPTYLSSAITGGLIMGVGFIIGGFCPGTSLCAAAIGKIDAWAFVAGSAIGILAFSEGYPLIDSLYKAQNLGSPTIFEMLNLSKEAFAIILASAAVGAFIITGRIEDKVNGLKTSYPAQRTWKYVFLGIMPFMLILLVSFTPDWNSLMVRKAEKLLEKGMPENAYPIDKLVAELIDRHHLFNLIDVRTAEEFEKSTIPFAVNIPLADLLDHTYNSYLVQKHKKNIFLAANIKDAKIACNLANMTGNSENHVLDVTPEQFVKMYYEPEIPSADASKDERDLFRYRLKTGIQLKAMEDRLKSMKQPVIIEKRKAQGGC